jgi:hypothetical protein
MIRKTYRRRPSVELLESMVLLSGFSAVTHHAAPALVTKLPDASTAKAPKPITGSLTGMDVIVSIPNSHAFLVTWQATGSSTVGPAKATATYQGTAEFTNKAKTEKITYTDGSGTLTLGNGSTLALTFTGSRRYTLGHPVTYQFNGTATVESGANQGHVDKFTASDTEPDSPIDLTVRFTLK